MAVASSTAAGARRSGPPPAAGVPIRTCIGCRNRSAAAELLRVVVAPEAASSPPGEPRPVVPDPRRRMAGRGAWVHPDQRCVELAVRRRAFARALRVSGPVDPAPVSAYLLETASASPDSAEPTRRNPAGDEKSMAQR
jgi:predicted RNA-binding protein YlxR (DUF448 family)